MLKRKIRNTDQNLPPISLVGNSTGNVLNVKKDKDKDKKPTRRTESILARMPKMQGTAPIGGAGTRFGGLNAGGLMARLKKFSPKEMGLLATGIMLLVMLPLGAHMMSADSGDNGGAGKPGFYASKSGGELFEPGLNGFAPGGTGMGGETITPLSVRDPLSLIIGPDARDPEVETPPAAPPIEPRDFRDTVTAVAPVAARAVSEVVSAPNIPKLNGAVRGLGAVSAGGTGGITGQLNSGKISSTANNAPSKISSSDMVSPIAMKGFAGASSRSNKSSSDAFDALKAKANNAADMMNEGSSLSGADASAKASNFGTGAAGAAGALGYVGGGAGKAGSASGAGDKSTVSKSKSAGGKLADKRAEKEMELEFKAKEAALQNRIDNKKFWEVTMPQKVMEKMLTSITDPIGKKLGDVVTNALNPGAKEAEWLMCKGADGNAIAIDGAVRKKSDDEKVGEFKQKCAERRGSITSEGGGSGPGGQSPNNNNNSGPAASGPQRRIEQIRENAPGDRGTLSGSKTSAETVVNNPMATPDQKVQAAQPFANDAQTVLNNKYKDGNAAITQEIGNIGTNITKWNTEIGEEERLKESLMSNYAKLSGNAQKFISDINSKAGELKDVGVFGDSFATLVSNANEISAQTTKSWDAAREDLTSRLANERQLVQSINSAKSKLEERNGKLSQKINEVSSQLTQLQSAPDAATIASVFDKVTTSGGTTEADSACGTLLGCVNYVNGNQSDADKLLYGKEGLLSKLPMSTDYQTNKEKFDEAFKEPTVVLLKDLTGKASDIEGREFSTKFYAENKVVGGFYDKMRLQCNGIPKKADGSAIVDCSSWPTLSFSTTPAFNVMSWK